MNINNVMDLYMYLAFGGVIYLAFMFGWVLISLKKWNRSLNRRPTIERREMTTNEKIKQKTKEYD